MMTSSILAAISGQFGASLQMMRLVLDQADDATWHGPVGQIPFWHVAYHVLFYVDLYLSRGEQDFTPPPFHQPDSNFFGPQSWAPEKVIAKPVPYDRPTLINYVTSCATRVQEILPRETEELLAGPSGFWWLPIPRLELHLYNLRHLQHHVGQLSAALRRSKGANVDWVVTHVPQ